MPEQKPDLSRRLSGEEFLRWYYLKTDLQEFARELGISASGSKNDIKNRIAAELDGLTSKKSKRFTTEKIDKLPQSLSLDTTVYPGQRLTKQLRDFMTEHCGKDFVFDGHMRKFFASDKEKTLLQATEHWRATRSLPRLKIEKQFEYNKFAQRWHRENPSGSHEEMVQAWKKHRSLPH